MADIGDVPVNSLDLKKSIEIIAQTCREILRHDVAPLTLGGEQRLT